MGRRMQLGLLPGDTTLGLFRQAMPNTVYINPYEVTHPLQIVNSLMHELGHARLWDANHGDSTKCGDEGHCIAWVTCARMMVAAFRVSTYLSYYDITDLIEMVNNIEQ